MSITVYRPSTGEQLPVESVTELQDMLKAGKVTRDDYCFYPGADNWKLLREVQLSGENIVLLPPLPVLAGPTTDKSTSGRHSHTFDVGLTLHTRHNVLAYVTFALGCLSFLFSVFAAIPGIICGRIAIKQCDADPSLLGRSWAKAGLILNWVIISTYLLLALLGFLFYAAIFAWGSLSRG